MDGNQFDRVTKWMSTRRTRRETVRTLIGGALSGAAVVAGSESALAGKPDKPPRPPKPIAPECCPASTPKLCALTCTDVYNDPGNCGGCGITCADGAICLNGSCSCPSGLVECTGVCVDKTTSIANCGACGNSCVSPVNGTATCVSGTCGFTCNSGFTTCGASCVDTSVDPNNCGSCSHICSAGCSNGSCEPTCSDGFKNGSETDIDCGGGTCSPCADGKMCSGDTDCASDICISGRCVTCPAGQTPCNDMCVSIGADPGNCGECGHVCALGHATSGCSNGQCTVAACNAGWADCNGNASDGCEVNIGSDPNNCGACGHICSSNNGTASCSNGACAITCISGFANCNNNPADGCEIHVATDPNNCGACGVVCNLNQATSSCSNGQCTVVSCNVGWADCNGNSSDGCEVNVATDPNNCGACGNRCGADKTCVSSVCV